MKRLSLFLLAVLLLICGETMGQDFSDINQGSIIYYKITSNTAPYTVDVTTCSGYYGCYSGNVVIPDSVTNNGLTYHVTGIGTNAFNNCYNLNSVIIPNSVTKIDTAAFYNCQPMTSITIPSSVKNIEMLAFDLCSTLTDIIVDSANTSFCSVDGVLFNIAKDTLIRYPGGKSGHYNIPITVTHIGRDAFDECDSLTSVGIPNSVTSISYSAFHDCDILTTIHLPNSVTDLYHNPFFECHNLTAIVLDSGNTNFYTENGILFDYNRTQLICYPAGKRGPYIIPDTVSRIGDDAFGGCYNLSKVTIPYQIISIGSRAFGNCTSLDSIVFVQNYPPRIAINTFFNVPNSAIIIVPCHREPVYRTALSQWFTNIVEDCDNAIDEAETSPLLMYPNPASETVTIEGLEENSDILIVNTLGSIVKRIENVGSTATITVGDLPKGVYFVRTRGTMRKLVVE